MQTAYQGKPIDVEACDRHGGRMLDALRLIQEGGLGWSEDAPADSVDLKLPLADLHCILTARKAELSI